MAKLTTRKVKNHKKEKAGRLMRMLTCYDYQTAQLLNETELDLILVGDSLGNVILGYNSTIQVTIEDMITFSSAVKRGAPDKLVICDMPFGTYSTVESAIENATKVMQKSCVEAVKIEGASEIQLKVINALTQVGIPVMGHIGLTPQFVNELGGYYTHGKNKTAAQRLLEEAKKVERAGAFSIVLECVYPSVTEQITKELTIPTIGIGSGDMVDADVLVTNDLLGMGKNPPPSFCTPISNLYDLKKELINSYLKKDMVNPGQMLQQDERPYS